MKISNNYNCFSFKARNKDVRTADKIVRTANKTFPATSPTYIQTFNYPQNFRLRKLCQKQVYNVRDMRWCVHEDVMAHTANVKIAECIESVNEAKRFKVANCYEKSMMGLATALANGYEAQRYTLGYKISIHDKNTKEKLGESRVINLDHSLVLSSMNNPKRTNIKDKIVIDPWLGTAETMSGAKDEFRRIFADEIQEEYDNYKEEIEQISKNRDIEVRSEFVFNQDEEYSKEEQKIIKQFMRRKYPELILDSKK